MKNLTNKIHNPWGSLVPWGSSLTKFSISVPENPSILLEKSTNFSVIRFSLYFFYFLIKIKKIKEIIGFFTFLIKCVKISNLSSCSGSFILNFKSNRPERKRASSTRLINFTSGSQHQNHRIFSKSINLT